MDSEHIFHIAQKSEWQAAEAGGVYTGESLKNDGFVHSCFRNQVDQVLKQWFAGLDDLLLIEIDPHEVDAEIRFENLEGGSQKFPHIYGPINLDAVISVSEIHKSS